MGDEDIKSKLETLLENYKICFVEISGLGRVDEKYAHKIDLVDEKKTVRTKPYRLTWEEDEFLKEQLDELLEKGVIRPSKGRWTSPVFFVPKKGNEKPRLVVNFKQLNDNTQKMNYPLPHINELLDGFGGNSKYLSCLDAANGFWQIPMDKDSIQYTGFICKHGTYEWLAMPFGLTTASDTYQGMMSNLLSPYIGKFVFCFIDDVIIFSRSAEEHLEHLKVVFEVCKAANLRLKRSKCQFFKKKVEYLGHVMTSEGVLPSDRNVKKILEMKAPNNLSEVQSLLGTTNYYRRFVENYSELLVIYQVMKGSVVK